MEKNSKITAPSVSSVIKIESGDTPLHYKTNICFGEVELPFACTSAILEVDTQNYTNNLQITTPIFQININIKANIIYYKLKENKENESMIELIKQTEDIKLVNITNIDEESNEINICPNWKVTDLETNSLIGGIQKIELSLSPLNEYVKIHKVALIKYGEDMVKI